MRVLRRQWARGGARLAVAMGAACCLAAAQPDAAAAQVNPAPTWMRETSALGLNALLGGLTAGVTQEIRGGSFTDGFARGALGGAVMYGGKRIAVERFSGAGLLGRQVAAMGISAVRNASDGVGSLERIVLPIGPVRVYLRPGAAEPVRARLDLVTTAAILYAAGVDELELDGGASLSAGAPVFVAQNVLIRDLADDTLGASGRTRAGAMYLSRIFGLDFEQDFAHERVHVVQNDFIFLAWTDPAEDRVLRMVPGGRLLSRYADLNLSPLVTTTLSRAFKNYHDRPWEVEARFLAER